MWKACREQERKIQGIMHDHKKRAERKAAYFAEKVGAPPKITSLFHPLMKEYNNRFRGMVYQFGDPMRAFSVVGLPASVNYDTAQYRLLEAGDSLYAPPPSTIYPHHHRSVPRLTCAALGVARTTNEGCRGRRARICWWTGRYTFR
jgi:hypothetical protein